MSHPAPPTNRTPPRNGCEAGWGSRNRRSAPTSWRLSHMMWLIAAIAVILFLIVKVGAPFVVFGAVLLFAMAVGAGVILARRRSTQQDSLLWILAIAAEGNMPLAPDGRGLRRPVPRQVPPPDHEPGGRARQRPFGPEALESVRRVVSRDALLLARVGEQTGRLPQALRLAASSRSSQLPIWTAIATRLAYLLALLSLHADHLRVYACTLSYPNLSQSSRISGSRCRFQPSG